MKATYALAVLVASAATLFGQQPSAAARASPATSLAAIHPAVARIVAPGNGSISYGSGTLVHVTDQAGLVITNWHVVNEATAPISVHFPDGFYSLGRVEQVDRDWDLAIISIRKPNAQPVALANEAPRQVLRSIGLLLPLFAVPRESVCVLCCSATDDDQEFDKRKATMPARQSPVSRLQ